MSTYSLNSAELCDVGHAQFCFSLVSIRKIAKNEKLFRTPPRQFDRFALKFAWSVCGHPWQKVIKRIALLLLNDERTASLSFHCTFRLSPPEGSAALLMDTNLCFRVCRVTQCSPLIICFLCSLQGVLLTSAYIIQYRQEQNTKW